MKAKGSILSILLIFFLASTAYAQDTRVYNAYAGITFSGTTANCYVEIPGSNINDKISATIELRCGSERIKTWSASSDEGYLFFHDSVSVTKGKTYELAVEYTVNGKTMTPFSGYATCK